MGQKLGTSVFLSGKFTDFDPDPPSPSPLVENSTNFFKTFKTFKTLDKKNQSRF